MATERTPVQKLDGLIQDMAEVKDVISVLKGNPDLGVKPPIERIFETFENLPCKENTDRINHIETKQAVSNGINCDRAKRTLMKDLVDEFKELPIWGKIIVLIFIGIFMVLFGGGGASIFI